MAKTKKITQNINKDAGLMDLPKVKPVRSRWENKWSNYLTCNIGDIVPVYVDEVLPSEKRRVTMGMLSHMTTPIAPIFNAQYTEFRSFFVPYRLAADLLGGYSSRKSPWVKVFGEDNASTSADIIVPLDDQKLPSVSSNLGSGFASVIGANSFGGIADALGYDSHDELYISDFNFLDMAAYELIYQYKYRNQNLESATNSNLYKWLFNVYNRTTDNIAFDDSFHKANREKDYFTGSLPFTQKGDPVSAGLVGDADVNFKVGTTSVDLNSGSITIAGQSAGSGIITSNPSTSGELSAVADLSSASGINIEQLRIMIKLQEALEKDAMWGSDYASSLNARFGTCPMSLIVEEPLELKKVTITSQMQPIFQTSTTSGEQTILGTIGANATTQSGEFEIVPLTEFKEYGLLIVCAVHKAQNSYDSSQYKPKRIFKKARFDFYTPELNDLGYQPVIRKEFCPASYVDNLDEAVSFNEAFAEYRYKFNQVHGMFEPSRSNALDYWTLSVSSVGDLASLYKQGTTELDRSISVTSATAPQFFDAYGFIETNDKPMTLHSIPGMDGVI